MAKNLVYKRENFWLFDLLKVLEVCGSTCKMLELHSAGSEMEVLAHGKDCNCNDSKAAD